MAAAIAVVIFGATPASPAAADSAPVVAGTPTTVTADALPTVQIDGVVWSQAVVGNTVYVAGSFTTARPAGSAVGVNTVPRSNILAYDITTGKLIDSFAPVLNGQALSITASPDGKRIYVVGDFTQVDGAWHVRVAAFDTATGKIVTAFRPSLSSRARAVAATNSTVYVGGDFASVAGVTGGTLVPHAYLAAFDSTTGALTPFSSDANAGVTALAVTADGSKLAVGGRFTTLGGMDAYGLGFSNPTTGSPSFFPTNTYVRDAGTAAAITSLYADASGIYGTGYVFGSGGNAEGEFRADATTGEMIWLSDCHGDTYSIFPQGDVVYSASHHHYCGNMGGFPQTTPWTFYHANAFTLGATGVNTADIYGYPSHTGQPSPSLLHWYPDFYTGSFTGQGQAAWSVSGNSEYLTFGGEFPGVNGAAQQGLVRFAKKDVAPNKQGPRVSGANLVVNTVSLAAGTARLSWTADYDRDNENLTYQVIRDGKTATPVYTVTAPSSVWKRPAMGFNDTGLTPGSTHTYALRVSDPFGNTVTGASASVTVASSGTVGTYPTTILGDAPTSYWRLGESTGTTSYDWAGWSDLTAGTGVTRGATGAIGSDTDTASTFDGTSAGFAATSTAITGPDTFSVESWVKTTSTSGGKIVGFGASNTTDSGSYDRQVYMDNSGKIWFGVYPNAVATLNSSSSYNDGQWHQVVAELSSAGMALYVDGKRVGMRTDVTFGQSYSGYWRIGGDNLGGWPNQPTSSYLAGAIDEVAVYPTVLSAGQIVAHYVASGRVSPVMPAPADAYGAAVYQAQPDLYWRLGESSGSTAADASTSGNNGTYRSGVTLGASGALAGTTNTAATFDGTTGLLSSNAQFAGPSTYSEELWFNTTTTNGGKLIGFGSSATGTSGSYDRHVYMENSGALTFGTWTGQTNTITSSATYNDGKWHHMVATQSSAGMMLYVDGVLVGTNPQTGAQSYTGYWRVGSDTTWGPQPYFAGTIDEVAVYPTALDAPTVALHYSLGTTGSLPNQAPTAAFTTSATKLALSVDGSGSTDPDGTVASYAWGFGDGATGTGATASHSYAAAGTYTVTLTVTDNKGATGVTTHAVTVVANQAPTAAFTTSATKLALSVDGSGSTDPDGTVASYAWGFGDGATGTGVTASHSYAAAGTYTVTLTVTDNNGATGVTTHDVTVVANQPPVASFTTTAVGLSISADGSGSTDPDGTVASYAWGFGDGATGTGATASHSYAAAGTYTVTLTVTDNNSATGVTTHDVTVAPPVGPVTLASDGFSRVVAGGLGSADVGGAWTTAGTASSFSVNGSAAALKSAAAGLTNSATLAAVSSTDTDLRADISMDKPATGGGMYIGVLGRKVATSDYRARVKVPATGAVQLQLLKADTSLVSTTITGLTYTTGDVLRVRLQVTGTSPTTIRAKVWKVGTAEPTTWQVSTTDSTASLQAAGSVGLLTYLSGSSTNAPVTVTYDNLWAGTTDGGPVANIAPSASFSSVATNLGITVDGTGSTDPDGSIASYGWTYGDGGTATGSTASHTYAAAGTYNVTLTVTDNLGATGTVSHAVTVAAANQPPTAAFTAVATGLVAALDGTGSSDPDGTVASYAWGFGDGATGTGATASHTYASAGTYTVTLTVADNVGATSTVTHQVTVADLPPVPFIAQDAFARTVVGGWGTADIGGAWTTTGAVSGFSVTGDSAHILLASAGAGARARLASVSAADVDVTATMSFDKLSSVGGMMGWVMARTVGWTDDYRAKLVLTGTGGASVRISRTVANVETTLGSAGVPGMTYVAGSKVHVRFQAQGANPTTLRVKVWADGAVEPTAWLLVTTDTSATLQGPGSVALGAYLAATSTSAPVSATFDDVAVATIG